MSKRLTKALFYWHDGYKNNYKGIVQNKKKWSRHGI